MKPEVKVKGAILHWNADRVVISLEPTGC